MSCTHTHGYDLGYIAESHQECDKQDPESRGHCRTEMHHFTSWPPVAETQCIQNDLLAY